MATTEQPLSLFRIEAELVELMTARSEATLPEEQAAFDVAIKGYLEKEIRKVDNVRGYIRHAEMMALAAADEAKIQRARADAWKSRSERLKQFCIDVMRSFDLKRLEGNTGTLSIKGNGGSPPVIITNDDLIPDDLCEYEGTVSGLVWSQIAKACPWVLAPGATGLIRKPRKSAIAEALKSGPVAGAFLADKGVHLSVG